MNNIFFDKGRPDSSNSLSVRVVRGMLDLFRHYRKLGYKNQASEMRDTVRGFVRADRQASSMPSSMARDWMPRIPLCKN